MLIPFSYRSRASIAVAILGLVALLSCQNDVTAPQSSTKVVTGHWNTEYLRMPDSAAWALHDTTGTLALTTFAKDTSFTVQALLPRALAPQDTLALSLFTLSLRTTLALCKADANGNLSLWVSGVHDPLAAHLLQVLDSLQKKSPNVWGAKTDSIAAQIRSLQKLYATLVLSQDATLQGFPAIHPFGIDTLAVIDQILILATQQKLTLHGLDSLVSSLASLDSAKIHKEVQKLGLAGKIDTLVLFPAPVVVANQAPSFAGATDIVKMLDTTAQTVPNWITAISAGPANEAGQIVHFEVVTDSGASLFSALPTVDSSGTLRYQAKSVGRGVFRVRAHDNGDSTGTSVNVSAWKRFAIQLSAKPVLTISGIPSGLAMVEDSLLRIPVTLSGADTATLRLVSGDTTLLGSLTRTVHRTDTLLLQAKPDANGGPVQVVFLLQGGGLADTVDAVVTVAARNDPPTFAGATDISKTLETTSQTISNWITAISAGPANESGQIVHFEVVADSGSNLFSALPTVDSVGTLRYQANSVGRGVFRVRAHDNGDSTGTNVNVSSWKRFAIQFFSRPVLIATGPSDTVRLVEDSTSTVSFTVQNFVGSSLMVKFAPVDTSLISAQSWKLVPDAFGKVTIPLQGKPYAYGGPITTIATLSDSVDASNLIVPITIAARNRPPTFGGARNLVVTASTATKSFPGWIDSIAAGPANESYQKVSFQVQVLDGAALFATAPSVDANGTLSFAGNANSSGLTHIQVRAVDNDSVDPGNRYSAWKTASIYFNQAPSLALPTHALSTWENQTASVGAAAVSDPETSPANLALSWTVSDSTILPTSGVIATFSGGTSRNITLHPLAHRWGTVKVVFTVTDSLGATAVDSLTLTVNPVNHAPTLVLKSPTLLATTWKGEQTYALASVVWDDATPGQSGHFDIQLANATDSVYLSTLNVDSVGTLHVLAKLDTMVNIQFQIRAHDNGGTANGGTDTSAWSGLQTLQLVDTVLDADGNSYRAKVLGTQTWMISNLQRIVGTATCTNDTCGKYGRAYTWDQALNMTAEQIANAYSAGLPVQGICPERWHVPTSDEWSTLQIWSGDSSSFKLRSRELWTDSTQHFGMWSGTSSIGTDRYGFSIHNTTIKSTASSATGDVEYTMGALFWTASLGRGGYTIPVYASGFFAPSTAGLFQSGDFTNSYYTFATASIRCIKDTTERSYTWISP
jgi:uncharacterized protein (TIGR02145 family)